MPFLEMTQARVYGILADYVVERSATCDPIPSSSSSPAEPPDGPDFAQPCDLSLPENADIPRSSLTRRPLSRRVRRSFADPRPRIDRRRRRPAPRSTAARPLSTASSTNTNIADFILPASSSSCWLCGTLDCGSGARRKRSGTVIVRLRRAWPNVQLHIRGDAGYGLLDVQGLRAARHRLHFRHRPYAVLGLQRRTARRPFASSKPGSASVSSAPSGIRRSSWLTFLGDRPDGRPTLEHRRRCRRRRPGARVLLREVPTTKYAMPTKARTATRNSPAAWAWCHQRPPLPGPSLPPCLHAAALTHLWCGCVARSLPSHRLVAGDADAVSADLARNARQRAATRPTRWRPASRTYGEAC